jgi:hypothetical protein
MSLDFVHVMSVEFDRGHGLESCPIDMDQYSDGFDSLLSLCILSQSLLSLQESPSRHLADCA